MRLDKLNLSEKGGRLTVTAELLCESESADSVKARAVFSCENHNRRLPLLTESVSGDVTRVKLCYTYLLDKVFYNFKAKNTRLEILVSFENGELPLSLENAEISLCRGVSVSENALVISQSLMNKKSHIRLDELKNREILKYVIRRPFVAVFGMYFKFYCVFHPVVQNRITIMSGRRKSLGGNSEFVYNILKNNPKNEIEFLFFEQKTGFSALKNLKSFVRLYATSRVVIVDDFFRMLNLVNKREGVKLIQLWHACGAFKTFGFTRLGKIGGPLQISKSHRMYDYTFVSSKEVARHYAEGFGINDFNVIPSGVARCDVFFDDEYKKSVRERLYSEKPGLKNKKLILFAPTFRGNGQQSAYYPIDKLNINAMMNALGEDYALIVKLHPFCKERIKTDETLKNRVFDFSDRDELNDLLFITDILVTDYSSVVFEASLLDIPMLFYAFDLEEYIASRDFYYDYKSFVPGKIVKSEQELLSSIKNSDFEREKVERFKNKFFDNTDGGSSQRAADLINSLSEV